MMSGDVYVTSLAADVEGVMTDSDADDRRIILNVGGSKHETFISTLRRLPGSRLSRFVDDVDRKHKEEYFFDRNPFIFASILDYYRTGQLHVPSHLCGPMIKAELEFWGLREYNMEACCWVGYNTFSQTQKTLAKFDDDHAACHATVDAECEHQPASCWSRSRACVWKFLDKPYSSRPAVIYAWMSLLMVVLSIVVYCLMTHPAFHHVTHSHDNVSNVTSSTIERSDTDIFKGHWDNYNILVTIDNICNCFFLLEFIAKIISTPNKLAFLRLPLSVIEILCILPYYLAYVIYLLLPQSVDVATIVSFLFFWRILRIFRIFSLVKHFQALKILVFTVRASLKELFLLVLILVIGMVLFASLIYFAEKDSKLRNDFPHIPKAFWWALITMTTVGYGDSVPRTDWGYCVGSLCAISGVLVIALTVPVIVNNFSLYYTHAQSTYQLKEHREQREKQQNSDDALVMAEPIKGQSGQSGDFERQTSVSLRCFRGASVSSSCSTKTTSTSTTDINQGSSINLINLTGENRARRSSKVSPAIMDTP